MSGQNLTLTASDGTEFVVERRVAEHSALIKDLLRDIAVDSDDEIPQGTNVPITEVDSQVLQKVLEWCRQRVAPDPARETGPWTHMDEQMEQIDNSMLIKIIKASNYLDIKALLEQSQDVASNRIRGKSPEDIKSMFRIQEYAVPPNLDFSSSASSETVTLLPYTSNFHATVTAAWQVRHMLQQILPNELANPIASSGYSPWWVKRRVDERTYHASDFSHPSVAGLYLSTDPIPYPPSEFVKMRPRRIVFQTRAADQGWVSWGGEGTFNNSHTWFEASILRPLTDRVASSGNFTALEDDEKLSEPFRNAESAREMLNEKGWDFVYSDNGEFTWRVCNNITAQREFQDYRNEWRRSVDTVVQDPRALGEGKGFLDLLEPGHLVVLWARAEYGGWVHYVEAATVEIELELL
ncbi:hypothetical protein COCC4DRAFT_21694 [Bipolaris maydis ATCC 48331]|uniref:SKP1 component POZ domain-containing protein n=2 Tax=Cochliobolus heterostrophus TaxID=5016 RepID=M2V0W5_COCH5|nr:uncharacterized protein COCC4DRAFT_21694 [Bipolaris maydis ATCC 48331]EMD93607.1 hypothetical protein COCHEDRAFT_1028772 [Bipolaris maydis C5]KAJ5027914.1 hypothetical protein J3E73DRAFT_37457 [Bipolaris maydis]ENI06944.1 hypothetical protein COCC4DRAFT_21694 [Bipolaris maydis ATCC 48331]KAJ6204851.1 hypothetical protein PSV09DRAFT_1028772 [Bipolaris maydis]KAJ6266448.1 hypothetical protein PSV08DRAFT_15808 [Bipolaris maydis]